MIGILGRGGGGGGGGGGYFAAGFPCRCAVTRSRYPFITGWAAARARVHFCLPLRRCRGYGATRTNGQTSHGQRL